MIRQIRRFRSALAGWVDPSVRRLQRDADTAWRRVRVQTRQLGRLHNARRRDQDQIDFLSEELRRVIGERFEVNVALGVANNEVERLTKELTAIRSAHDLEERRASRYRLAWVSCRQTRTQVRTQVRESAHG
jgi:chromosome segregation ATPase